MGFVLCGLAHRFGDVMIGISSFESVNGRTWAVNDGFCVLGYFKSLVEARRRRVEVYLARKRPFKPAEDAPLPRNYNLFGEVV